MDLDRGDLAQMGARISKADLQLEDSQKLWKWVWENYDTVAQDHPRLIEDLNGEQHLVQVLSEDLAAAEQDKKDLQAALDQLIESIDIARNFVIGSSKK